MLKKERFRGLLEYFSKYQPNPETELQYGDPYELIVAVVLSAQCTDKRVNLVTPFLFESLPDARAMAGAAQEEVFEIIKSISYPNNKAKHLRGLAKMLLDDFNGEVPNSIENLIKLPGVGRKTANVIASVVHDLPTMAVDTHVFRVSHRMGLVPLKANTPLKVELALVNEIPEVLIPKAHHWLILHGRYTCVARNPSCDKCDISAFCKSYRGIKKSGIQFIDARLPKIG